MQRAISSRNSRRAFLQVHSRGNGDPSPISVVIQHPPAHSARTNRRPTGSEEFVQSGCAPSGGAAGHPIATTWTGRDSIDTMKWVPASASYLPGILVARGQAVKGKPAVCRQLGWPVHLGYTQLECSGCKMNGQKQVGLGDSSIPHATRTETCSRY